MATRKFTTEILTAAIEGLEAQKKRINAQIAELRQTLNGGSPDTVATPGPARRRRRMSAAARQRIAEAQRKRWAAARGKFPSSAPSATPAKKGKRRLSAAGRRRIIEATKRRWALVRAQKPAAKKATGKRTKKAGR
jgi:hypothetical protein